MEHLVENYCLIVMVSRLQKMYCTEVEEEKPDLSLFLYEHCPRK